MMLALLLSLTQAPVTVQLNHEQFSRGDRARVYVETAQDGHLVVLHADPDGRVRVLFPLDPTDDDFVRGGRRHELRGRSDRDAFLVDGQDGDGAGTVLAAVARDPFSYDAFVRNDHWDYRALGGPSLRDDPLAGLLDIVQRMGGEVRFEYDAATYVVESSRYISSRYRYGSGYGIGLSFGYRPYRYGHFYNSFYDPFYDPFCYDAFWGWSGGGCNRYGFGNGYGFGYSYYRPRYYGFGYGRTFVRGGSGFVIPRDRDVRGRYTPVDVRPRLGSRERVSRGVEPRQRGGSVKPAARPRGEKPSVAPRGGRSGGSKPSVAPRGGRSGGSKPSVAPRGGRSGGSKPSVAPRGGGSRPAPASRPSNGGTRRRS